MLIERAAVSLLLTAGPAVAIIPQLFGRNGPVNVDDLPYRNKLSVRSEADIPTALRRDPGPGGTCGGTFTCDTDVNKCCSAAGWCGDTVGMSTSFSQNFNCCVIFTGGMLS